MSVDETIVSSLDDLELERATDPYLIVVAGQDVGKLHEINGDLLVAGRSPDCDICIDDVAISRRHFSIKRTTAEYLIEDLNSTNGTFINNKRVTTHPLKAGDKIQISKDTILQFDFFDEHRKVSEKKRYEMGVMDPVTNAFNKSYFLQRISDEFSFSFRQNIPLSLLMFDIDFFKQINDRYGHLAGDQVLQEISATVKTMIRTEDVFCRYGGEEFVVIMRNTPCQAAVNLAERIRRAIEAHQVEYDDQLIKVTISIGVATSVDKNFRDYVSLIADTDKYLYQSKGSGRNRVSARCMPDI